MKQAWIPGLGQVPSLGSPSPALTCWGSHHVGIGLSLPPRWPEDKSAVLGTGAQSSVREAPLSTTWGWCRGTVEGSRSLWGSWEGKAVRVERPSEGLGGGGVTERPVSGVKMRGAAGVSRGLFGGGVGPRVWDRGMGSPYEGWHGSKEMVVAANIPWGPQAGWR